MREDTGEESRGQTLQHYCCGRGRKGENGGLVISKVDESSPDPIRLGGVGNKVALEVEKLTGIETRVTVLGHLQRGGRPNPYDRILSTRYGVKAVELATEGKFGCMVSLCGSKITCVSLEEAVGRLKQVEPGGELVHIARSVGVCFGD